MNRKITLNFYVYPLVVGQFDKYTFSGWKEEGGTIQLKAAVEDVRYTPEDVVWTSEDSRVATVEDGLVRAMTTGITDICATLPDGSCAKCTIHVIDNFGRLTQLHVSLNTKRLVLNKLDGAVLCPVILPVDYYENGMLDKTFTWTSSNPDVVLVDHRGRVFGRECGTATVTGISNDVGREVSCEIEVIKKKNEDLYIDPLEDMDGGRVVMKIAGRQQLKLPEEVRQQPVCWCSDNAAIVSVNQDGCVKAYRSGKTTVWATFINGGHRIGYTIEVEKLPEHEVTAVHLNVYEMRLSVGMQGKVYAAVYPATLLEKQLEWKSSEESVLKIVKQHINLSGLDEVIVEAVREGDAFITGVCKNSDGTCQEVTCRVTVSKEYIPVKEMMLPTELKLEPGEVYRLETTVNEDAFSREMIWISENRTIATVDKDGFVKGYERGTVNITAVAQDGLSEAECEELRRIAGIKNLSDSKNRKEKERFCEIITKAVCATCTICVAADSEYLTNLHVPQETITDNSVCLLWNRKALSDTDDWKEYELYQDGKLLAKTGRISYTIKNLDAAVRYCFEVAAVDQAGGIICKQSVEVTTKPATAAVLDVTKEPYHALGNGIATDTHEIQRAIDDCPEGGMVLLPEGYVFYCGALFLKSNMTFRIDGILLGSSDPEDYPYVVCRWEGYRMLCQTSENLAATVPVLENNVYSHSSLINVGVYDEGDAGQLSPCHTENVHICGTGMINGNGFALGYMEGPCWYTYRKGLPNPQSPMRDQNVRGRAIAIYNTKHAYVSDVTVAYGPAWTIHPVFSQDVTFDNVKVISMGNGRTGVMEGMLILNGDGIDPDSSIKVNIMGCYFTVGDDAVAIKSGRNRQGNELAKPSAYIRVTDCVCIDAKGSFCIGSEQSGGAHDILFQNLYVENLMHFGLWIKSAPCRGGLVEDVLFRDCTLKETGGAVQIEYNHGGDENPSPVLPNTRRITYENIQIEGKHKFGIRIMGVPDSPIEDVILRRFSFKNFVARKERKFYLSDCNRIQMTDVDLPDGYEWEQE